MIGPASNRGLSNAQRSVRLSAVLRFAAILALFAAGSVDLSAQSSKREENRQRSAAAASSSSSPTGGDVFDNFRTIGDRNIFDPDRVPRTRRDSSSDVVAPVEDVISFVGTMQYEKGLFAFFDGSDARNRQALPSGAKVAGFTVTQISPHTVELTLAERVLSLRMGESLRRREGGDWTLSTVPMVAAEAAPAPGSSTLSRPPSPNIPGDASATLRRLMEQRQKQLKE